MNAKSCVEFVLQAMNNVDDEYLNVKIAVDYVSTLSELQTRQYIKRLNMQYVDTNRNLFSFLSREKSKILQIANQLKNKVRYFNRREIL